MQPTISTHIQVMYNHTVARSPPAWPITAPASHGCMGAVGPPPCRMHAHLSIFLPFSNGGTSEPSPHPPHHTVAQAPGPSPAPPRHMVARALPVHHRLFRTTRLHRHTTYTASSALQGCTGFACPPPRCTPRPSLHLSLLILCGN